MGNDDDQHEDTPPTGVHIPRPQRRAEPPPPSEPPVTVSFPPPPINPTVADVYALIDARLSPKIVERISSTPPPKAEPPRQSMPVRAAKTTGRFSVYASALLGLLVLIGQYFADFEKYRGPISQALVIIARVMDEREKSNALPPESERMGEPMLPEPASRQMPPLVHEPELAPPPEE